MYFSKLQSFCCVFLYLLFQIRALTLTVNLCNLLCAGSSGSSFASSSSSCGATANILSASHPQCDYAARRAWGIGTDRILHQTCGGNSLRVNAQLFTK